MAAANNKRIQWSPLLFAIAAIWAILAWLHKPASFGYLSACIVVGFVCGALIIVDLWKEFSPLVFILWNLVFFSSPMFIAAFLYSDFDGKMNYQYMSVVVASVLGLIAGFRGPLIKSGASDAEQIGYEGRSQE